MNKGTEDKGEKAIRIVFLQKEFGSFPETYHSIIDKINSSASDTTENIFPEELVAYDWRAKKAGAFSRTGKPSIYSDPSVYNQKNNIINALTRMNSDYPEKIQTDKNNSKAERDDNVPSGVLTVFVSDEDSYKVTKSFLEDSGYYLV